MLLFYFQQVPSHPSFCGNLLSAGQCQDPVEVSLAAPLCSPSGPGAERVRQGDAGCCEPDSQSLLTNGHTIYPATGFLVTSVPLRASSVAAGGCPAWAAFAQVLQVWNVQQIKEPGCTRMAAAPGLLERLFYRWLNRQFVVRHCFLNIA